MKQLRTKALAVLVEAVSSSLPVDDLPNGLEVIGAHVFVLKIVGVLPDIDSQKRDQASGRLKRILVGGGGDLETLELLVVTLSRDIVVVLTTRSHRSFQLYNVK